LSHSINVGHRTDAGERAPVEEPHDVGNRSAMRVDQQSGIEVVAILGEAGEMDFADMLHRKSVEISHRLEAVIDCRHVDIVDVEQKPAPGALDDRAQELGLAHGRSLERDVSRGILEQDGALKNLLHLVDVVGDAG
jgi:hypothetical protein